MLARSMLARALIASDTLRTLQFGSEELDGARGRLRSSSESGSVSLPPKTDMVARSKRQRDVIEYIQSPSILFRYIVMFV